MQPIENRGFKKAFLWVFLILAVAGTFVLTKKISREGLNTAGAYLSGNPMHKIFLSQNKAEPETVTVRRGDQIAFIILDDSIHHVAEERTEERRGARLSSGDLRAGESYTLSFGASGTYYFYDRMNPEIHVTIVVR